MSIFSAACKCVFLFFLSFFSGFFCSFSLHTNEAPSIPYKIWCVWNQCENFWGQPSSHVSECNKSSGSGQFGVEQNVMVYFKRRAIAPAFYHLLLLLCMLGAVANYRHFVSNERCSFELKPLPPPPNEHTHYMHMEKRLTNKCGYCLHDAVHMVVSRSPKYFREGLWCPWLYRRAFLVLLLERGCSVPSAIRSAHHWQR